MKKILVSANDPGGANAIAPVVKELISQGDTIVAFLTGPARDIFSANQLDYTDVSTWTHEELSSRITEYAPDLFLAGTSGSSSIDKRVMDHLAGSIPSVYVLDFWNNYVERFSKEGRDLTYLPDMICVMDERAKKEMMQEGIEGKKISVTGNPYFEYFTDGVTADGQDLRQILFISQPISTMPESSYGFDEFQTLEGVCTALMMMPATYHLSIRLHPRDDVHKYDHYLGERVTLSKEATLETALSRAGHVIGMFSPVLMQSALAGKHVLRFLPHSTISFMNEFAGIVPLATTVDDMVMRLIHAGTEPEKIVGAPGWVVPGATKNVLRIIDSL